MTDTQRLDEAIRTGLGLPGEMDLTEVAYGETEEWDSVAHMELVATIEAAFGIMIDTDHVIAMSDYRMAQSILSNHYGVQLEP